MGTNDVLIAAMSLLSVCVTSWTAWKLRYVARQLNGVREELHTGAVKEGELVGRDFERRRQRDQALDLHDEALERGRQRMARLAGKDDPGAPQPP